MSLTSQFSFDEVRQVLGGVLGPYLHAKRVDSLSNATLGVLHSGSLAVAAIGHGLAAARGVLTKPSRSGFVRSLDQEADLAVHPEHGDLVVFHDALGVLHPERLDATQRL